MARAQPLSKPGWRRQKRSGSAFTAQARWPEEQVAIRGTFSELSPSGDSGRGATFRFCGRCGSTMAYVIEAMPGVIAVPIGAFADLTFPSPRFSVYEQRKHSSVAVLRDDVERHY